RQPGRFLLTGSSNVLQIPRIADSLAGRIEIIPLWPLAEEEIEGASPGFVDRLFASGPFLPNAPQPEGAGEVVERILRGGYPEALVRARADRRRAWFQSYLTTILERDVRDLANI